MSKEKYLKANFYFLSPPELENSSGWVLVWFGLGFFGGGQGGVGLFFSMYCFAINANSKDKIFQYFEFSK